MLKPQYRLEPVLTPKPKDSIGSFPKRKNPQRRALESIYEIATRELAEPGTGTLALIAIANICEIYGGIKRKPKGGKK